MQISVRKRIVDGLVVGLSVGGSWYTAASGTDAGANANTLDQYVANDADSQNLPWHSNSTEINEHPRPLGFDPSGCLPSDPLDLSFIDDNNRLVSESGDSVVNRLFLSGTAEEDLTFELRSTNPLEGGTKDPLLRVAAGQSCTSFLFEVEGRNDGIDDGDQSFAIEVVDREGVVADEVTYINIDNDQIPEVSVSVVMPEVIEPGRQARFSIRIENWRDDNLLSHRLTMRTSSAVTLESAQCELLSGAHCIAPVLDASMGTISLEQVDLASGDVLLVNVDVTANVQGQQEPIKTATVSALFSGPLGVPASDNIGVSSVVVHKDGFEDPPEN